MNHIPLRLEGQKFGRLTVISKAKMPPNKRRNSYWNCICECGNSCVVKGTHLRNGKTRSCGCLIRDITAQRNRDNADGIYRHERLYRIYYGMMTRCYNEKEPKYKRYGARGISVCDEWKNNFLEFQKWAFSNGYNENLTLDRINNDGNYTPNNCRWADNITQSNNRANNRNITYNGETKTVAEWSRATNISTVVLTSRLNKGWSPEEALTIPVGMYIGGKYNHVTKLTRGEKI